jgi:hypothetical protein
LLADLGEASEASPGASTAFRRVFDLGRRRQATKDGDASSMSSAGDPAKDLLAVLTDLQKT